MKETSRHAVKAYEVDTGKFTNAYNILVKNLKGNDHFENLWLDKIIILKWILNTHGKSVD